MTATITLLANATNYNGSIAVDIFDRGQTVYSRKEFNEGPNQIEFNVNWPTTVSIITSNRNPKDTVCDSNGIIVNNKCLEVTGISINQFAIHMDLVDKMFHCQRNGHTDIVNANFWDFNGQIQMHLTHNSPMRFMLSLQNQFDVNRLMWNNQ